MLPGQLCGFVLIVVVVVAVVEAVVVGVIVAAVGAVVVAFVVVDVGVAVAVVEEPPSVVLAWGHQAPHCCSASSSPRKVRSQVGGLFHFPLLLTSSLRCSQRSLVRLDCSSGD